MLANSNNPWVPFGSMRGYARSLEEHRAYLKSETQRRKKAGEKSKLEKYLAEARKATTQRLNKMREMISRAESSARAALFKELKSLPVEGRLVHIALDDEHELLFYSPELLDGLPDSLSAEAAWALEKMLARAAEIRTGPWRAWINQTNNKQKEEISHGGSV
jgi:signal transduction histidine kinase